LGALKLAGDAKKRGDLPDRNVWVVDRVEKDAEHLFKALAVVPTE
jgi:hypothetical protein